jgi:adenosylhomocysteine nucleosidase
MKLLQHHAKGRAILATSWSSRAARTLLACAATTVVWGCGGAAAPPSEPSRIAVVAPMDLELAPLLEQARIAERRPVAGQVHHLGTLAGHDVVLVRCGRSLVASAAATQAVLDHHLIAAVVVSGIAGGINPEHDVGDVVVPARWGQYQEHVVARRTAEGFDPGVRRRGSAWEGFGAFFSRPQRLTWLQDGMDADEMRFWFDADPRMLEAVQRAAGSSALERRTPEGRNAPDIPRLLTGGQGVSGNGFVDNAEYREWIWRSFEASAVDQETAAIAQVAYTNGVPFIAFRGISDLAGGREGPNQARDLAGLAAGNAARAALAFLEEWEWPDEG